MGRPVALRPAALGVRDSVACGDQIARPDCTKGHADEHWRARRPGDREGPGVRDGRRPRAPVRRAPSAGGRRERDGPRVLPRRRIHGRKQGRRRGPRRVLRRHRLHVRRRRVPARAGGEVAGPDRGREGVHPVDAGQRRVARRRPGQDRGRRVLRRRYAGAGRGRRRGAARTRGHGRQRGRRHVGVCVPRVLPGHRHRSRRGRRRASVDAARHDRGELSRRGRGGAGCAGVSADGLLPRNG